MSCWNEPTGFHVYVLSWISLIITLIAGIGGIVAYYTLDSSLILVYGLENLVDFMSSAIVHRTLEILPSAAIRSGGGGTVAQPRDESERGD